MNILHAHYSPDESGLTFWAETAEAAAPKSQRGRIAENPKPRPHPFSVAPNFPGEKTKVALQLPAVRGIPLPSPQLVHNWEIETENPVLAPFVVDGIFCPPEAALTVLLDFSTPQPDLTGPYTPSPAFRYWSLAASLILETLAAQKLVPVVSDQRAVWLPVLDSPKDAARLAQLIAAMPAACRAALASGPSPKGRGESPKHLLTSFINTFCDSLAPGASLLSRSFTAATLRQAHTVPVSFREGRLNPPIAGWKRSLRRMAL
jgi:hypothetical protein